MSTLFTGGPVQTPADEKRCWRTDRIVAHLIFSRYGIPMLDAAATDGEVALAPAWISPSEDGLDPAPWWDRACGREMGRWPCPDARWNPRWTPLVWLNPPWGTGKLGTGAWVDRALLELREQRVSRVLLLLPEATDTAWWWRAATASTEVVSLGRIAYCRPSGDRIGAPPQGSTLFVLDAPTASPAQDLRPEGASSSILSDGFSRIRSFSAWPVPRRAQQLAARVQRGAVVSEAVDEGVP
jgi:hypothetical protein